MPKANQICHWSLWRSIFWTNALDTRELVVIASCHKRQRPMRCSR